VWILNGGNVPFLLRPGKGGDYSFVGEAYVHEIMYGEALGVAEKRMSTTVLV